MANRKKITKYAAISVEGTQVYAIGRTHAAVSRMLLEMFPKAPGNKDNDLRKEILPEPMRIVEYTLD